MAAIGQYTDPGYAAYMEQKNAHGGGLPDFDTLVSRSRARFKQQQKLQAAQANNQTPSAGTGLPAFGQLTMMLPLLLAQNKGADQQNNHNLYYNG
jgi:hypothetical protein